MTAFQRNVLRASVLLLCCAAIYPHDAAAQRFLRPTGQPLSQDTNRLTEVQEATEPTFGAVPETESALVSGDETIASTGAGAFVSLLGRPGKAIRSTPPQDERAPTAATDPVACQAALDRAGFSPGLIDGKIGQKTLAGLRAFQASKGLAVTGSFDPQTRRALGVDAQPALVRYALTDTDMALVGPWPKDWVAKSQARRLGYASLASLAAERGHCTLGLLARLNPDVDLKTLKPGDTLRLPNVVPPKEMPQAAGIEVDFLAKTVRALDAAGRAVAMFHCSIAKHEKDLPSRPCRVASVAMNPIYLFDPKKWPEVKGVDRCLEIPPGPRNPVGLCWIGLSLKGYGIHGTPEPAMIGKTGSHGCVRLTNWDVLRLAKIVRVGTPVRFVSGASPALARQ